MSARIIPIRPRLRPLAKAKPRYPEPPEGIALVQDTTRAWWLRKHVDGHSVELRLSKADLVELARVLIPAMAEFADE